MGGACQIRQARESQLGTLAASIAPRQPIGDAAVILGTTPHRPSNGSPWRRVLLVGVLAGVITVASGPIAGAVGPALTSLLTALTAPGTETPTPSADVTPVTSPSDEPNSTPSPSELPSPSTSPAESPAAAKTYVVQSGDTLYDIAMTLGLGPNGVQELATLNGITDPSTIRPGQVLKLP